MQSTHNVQDGRNASRWNSTMVIASCPHRTHLDHSREGVLRRSCKLGQRPGLVAEDVLFEPAEGGGPLRGSVDVGFTLSAKQARMQPGRNPQGAAGGPLQEWVRVE